MVRFTVSVRGYEETQVAMVKLGAEAPVIAGKALYIRGNKIMKVAKDERVPVDLGALKGSGYVRKPRVTARGATVVMGFGGVAKAYALVQHERKDYHHTVGGPKYLSGPAHEQAEAARRDVHVAIVAAAKRMP